MSPSRQFASLPNDSGAGRIYRVRIRREYSCVVMFQRNAEGHAFNHPSTSQRRQPTALAGNRLGEAKSPDRDRRRIVVRLRPVKASKSGSLKICNPHSPRFISLHLKFWVSRCPRVTVKRPTVHLIRDLYWHIHVCSHLVTRNSISVQMEPAILLNSLIFAYPRTIDLF